MAAPTCSKTSSFATWLGGTFSIAATVSIASQVKKAHRTGTNKINRHKGRTLSAMNGKTSTGNSVSKTMPANEAAEAFADAQSRPIARSTLQTAVKPNKNFKLNWLS